MRQQLIDLSKEWPALFNNKPNKVDEIYKEIKNILSNITKKSNHQDYIKIKATKGVANIPFAPWIGARDVRLADKQGEGYSLVYLYSVDLKKVHLSIAFGTEQFIDVFKPKKVAYEKMREAASRIQKNYRRPQLALQPSDTSIALIKILGRIPLWRETARRAIN